MSNEETLQKVAEELAARIGQITTQYEGQLAMLKVQASEQVDTLQNRIFELEAKVAELEKPAVDKPAKD